MSIVSFKPTCSRPPARSAYSLFMTIYVYQYYSSYYMLCIIIDCYLTKCAYVCVCIYIYIYTYVCIYIYIHIIRIYIYIYIYHYRPATSPLGWCTSAIVPDHSEIHMQIYIYIYIQREIERYIYIYRERERQMYVYIYIYRERERQIDTIVCYYHYRLSRGRAHALVIVGLSK